jgi:hypothetical protein
MVNAATAPIRRALSPPLLQILNLKSKFHHLTAQLRVFQLQGRNKLQRVRLGRRDAHAFRKRHGFWKQEDNGSRAAGKRAIRQSAAVPAPRAPRISWLICR